MSWSARHAWSSRPQTEQELFDFRCAVRDGFYRDRKDTARIALETGYGEALVYRTLNAIREARRAVDLNLDRVN